MRRLCLVAPLGALLLACSGLGVEESHEATTGGGGARTVDPDNEPELGAPCTSDSGCPRGAFCLGTDSSRLLGGGPPRGVCVADCTEDSTVCAEFRDASCVDVSEPRGPRVALCFETCSFGSPGATKCHDLDQVACEPTDSSGFCRPLCSRHRDCPEDHRCAFDLGVCVPGSREGSRDLSSECDPEATGEECAGLCVDTGSELGLCSVRCRFGVGSECATTEPADAACLLVAPGGTVGDLGYCAPLCECDDDCPDQLASCVTFEDEALAAAFGSAGACRAGPLRTPCE